MDGILEFLNDVLFNTDWAHILEEAVQSLKFLPFMPFYFLQIISVMIGSFLQDITAGLITDDMIHNFSVFIGYIGSLFIIK